MAVRVDLRFDTPEKVALADPALPGPVSCMVSDIVLRPPRLRGFRERIADVPGHRVSAFAAIAQG